MAVRTTHFWHILEQGHWGETISKRLTNCEMFICRRCHTKWHSEQMWLSYTRLLLVPLLKALIVHQVFGGAEFLDLCRFRCCRSIMLCRLQTQNTSCWLEATPLGPWLFVTFQNNTYKLQEWWASVFSRIQGIRNPGYTVVWTTINHGTAVDYLDNKLLASVDKLIVS